MRISYNLIQKQLAVNLLWSVCNSLCNFRLQTFCKTIIALTGNDRKHIYMMNIAAKYIGIHALSVLIDTKTQSSSYFLTLAYFTAALLQGANLENIGIIPSLTKGRVRKDKSDRRFLWISLQKQLLIFHNEVICIHIVRSLVLLVITGNSVDNVSPFVNGKIARMCVVCRNLRQIRQIRLLPRLTLQTVNNILILFLKHLRKDTVPRLSG